MTPVSTRCYLAETYEPCFGHEEGDGEAARLRAATGALAAEGVAVRHLGSLFLPGEETAFHLFQAEQRAAVEQALRRAGIEFERISRASVADAAKRTTGSSA